MNCEQVPFPKNISPKNRKVDIFEEIDKIKGNKTKLKPFTNLFKDLANYDPDKKKITRKNNDDDEEYKPSLKEIKETENEDEDKSKNYLKKKEQEKIMIINKINHNKKK